MVYKDMLRVAFGLDKPLNTLVFFETKKPNVDLSRNMVTAQMLKEKCEWLFFLDADVVPPLQVIPELTSANVPIISGLYWRRYEDMDPCIYHLSSQGIPVPFKETELAGVGRGVIEVDGCGAGCLLVHNSVFEKLKPYVEPFDIIDPLDPANKLKCWKFWEYIVKTDVNLSEDIVLSAKVKALGYRIYADLGLRCGHLCNYMIKDGRIQQTPLTTGHDV